jgi:hypothetical protein
MRPVAADALPQDHHHVLGSDRDCAGLEVRAHACRVDVEPIEHLVEALEHPRDHDAPLQSCRA